MGKKKYKESKVKHHVLKKLLKLIIYDVQFTQYYLLYANI